MKDRKWTLAIWGMLLGTMIIVASIYGWFNKASGAAGILGQGIGIIVLVFGGYATANVAQKNVISKNYKPELDEREK